TRPLDSTDGNSVLDKPAPGSISAPTADNRTQPVHKSSALTWIVGISALVVLLMGSTFAGMFLVRYMRRSRRLHGKYNPAREEHAIASTYSMPMTSVGKEERLI
ncbi:EAT-20 protein, partial [Aphelenchoides avenae]